MDAPECTASINKSPSGSSNEVSGSATRRTTTGLDDLVGPSTVEAAGKPSWQHSREGRLASIALQTVASLRYVELSTDLLDTILMRETTLAGPGLVGVFPVRNLTDALHLDYVLSFVGDH